MLSSENITNTVMEYAAESVSSADGQGWGDGAGTVGPNPAKIRQPRGSGSTHSKGRGSTVTFPLHLCIYISLVILGCGPLTF
jgi:hypothetical protein